jgi:hypothetical protein
MKVYAWNILYPEKSKVISDKSVIRIVINDEEYIEVRPNPIEGKDCITIRHSSRDFGKVLTVQPVVSNEIKVFIGGSHGRT